MLKTFKFPHDPKAIMIVYSGIFLPVELAKHAKDLATEAGKTIYVGVHMKCTNPLPENPTLKDAFAPTKLENTGEYTVSDDRQACIDAGATGVCWILPQLFVRLEDCGGGE